MISVKELIEKLQQYDPYNEVVIVKNYPYEPISEVIDLQRLEPGTIAIMLQEEEDDCY